MAIVKKVSIRARSIERAIPSHRCQARSVVKFQSAPARLSGRYFERGVWGEFPSSFNPRPLD